MKKNTKLTKGLCMLLAVVMAFGCSLAYFTDYATTQANGTAGTVAVSMDSDVNLLNDEGMDIINPGDMRNGAFSVTNEGNKSIDVRSTIALTALDHNGDPINFTGSATEQSEYDLYLASDVELVEGYGYQPVAGATPLEVKSIDGNVITYVLPEYSLNGNSDKYDEVETIEGVDEFAHANDFVFVMKGAAGNEWQDSSVQLDIIVEAKQHENTNAGWDIVAQESLTHGSITKDVVKGESVITEADGATNSNITVVSKDADGNDLNASASVIEGQEAEDLLNSLEQAGLATADDVDLLIDVKSDDFDGMADTTIDVSSVAQDGDTVVVLHYDETKGEWEYITTDTVENGVVSGDFSSYSPVAIVVIPKEDEGEDTPELNPDAEHKLMEMSFSGTFNYKKIVFTNESVPAGVETTDVSEAQDGSIVQYADGQTLYITTVDGGKIIAPDDISGMFGNSGFEEIHFHNFDVSNVTTANEVFPYVSATVYMDEAAWDAMPGMNDTTLATDPYGDTSILVNCQPLDACQGHETAECQHESGMYNPMTSTTHEFYCYGCTASFEQDCVFSAETGKCEKCSNESMLSFMPMSPEWQSLWTTYRLNSKPQIGTSTITVAEIEAMYAAQGYDLAADGKKIAGIAKTQGGELAQSLTVSAGETVYIVLDAAEQEIPEGVDINSIDWYGDRMSEYSMSGVPMGEILEYRFVSKAPETYDGQMSECYWAYVSDDVNGQYGYVIYFVADHYGGPQWIIDDGSDLYQTLLDGNFGLLSSDMTPVNMDEVIVY